MTTLRQLERERRRADGDGDGANAAARAVTPVAPLLMAGAIVCPVALIVAMETSSYDTWAAFWIAPLLLLLTIPIATRASRLEDDPGLGRFLLLAAGLKVLVGSAARYFTIYYLYDGTADAERYHDAGVLLADQFRRGDYSDLGKISGTRFMEIATGQVYAITGATRLGAFMVFSWLGFLGLYFFYRAFRIALAGGDHRRYRPQWRDHALPRDRRHR